MSLNLCAIDFILAPVRHISDIIKLKTCETSARYTFRLLFWAILVFITVSNLIVGQFGKYF